MKPNQTKIDFIKLRAEGRSYSYIAEHLHISKSTCTEWERELKAQIAEQRQEQLNEICTYYGLTKEARIKQLGETLKKIDGALDNSDLSMLPEEKLLDYKLKYTEALKREYNGLNTPYTFGSTLDAQEILNALTDLLERIRAGEVTPEQAQRENGVLSSLLKVYDTVEVKAKLDALENIIGGRR